MNIQQYNFDFNGCSSVSDMDLIIRDELEKVLKREPTEKEVQHIWSNYASNKPRTFS